MTASRAPRTRRPAPGGPKLTFHAVDEGRWKDLEALFERRGGPSYCWCMAWRATPAEAKSTGRTERKAALRKRVRAGVPVGLLGYAGGQPVAWCSVAPRQTFRRLGGPAEESEAAEARVWSIVCFFVRREYRRAGVMKQLLASAIRHARKEGARVLEAYPVDADSPSYRFMGFVPAFEAAGFHEVGRAGSRRHVVRRPL